MAPTDTETKAPRANWSARRINHLAQALGARCYLEIGVNKGTTFHSVAVRERIAVDPRFLFEYRDFANANTHFHEVTSDEYFRRIESTARFDICFLDGLHTFEQTLRDFCNTLSYAHDRTVWLIDDTKPYDVYSALRDAPRAFRYRHAAGDTGYAWHGDVFKIVFFLHDFFPLMNYRTISSGGNLQTLVWRSQRGWRKPCYNDTEAISRMNYFDMLDRIEILRETPEKDALQLCIQELTD
jgi:hypothetical protein